MKASRLALTAASLLLLMTVAMQRTHAEPLPQPQWYAEIYPEDSHWIQVQVDTRSLFVNAIVHDVSVSIGYYDASGDLLGGSDFDFTDVNQSALYSGTVYQKFFANPYPTAISATGLTLSSSIGAGGTLYDKKIVTSRNGQLQYVAKPGISAATAAAVSTHIARAPVSKVVHTFHIPGDGQRNNNGTIGPFCCSGETVTINDGTGQPVGYINAFGFKGGVNLGNGTSGVTSISVLLHASPRPTPGPAQPVQSALSFDAASFRPGWSQTAQVGALSFMVTLDSAKVIALPGNRKGFDLSSPRVTVQVSSAN